MDRQAPDFPRKPLVMALAAALCVAAPQTWADDDSTLESTQDMEEIVVLGQKETLTQVKTERLVQVAGAGNDPMRAIASLPGVTFTSGRGGGEPAVRGSSPQENLYIVDFLPVGYVFHVDGSSILSDNTVQDFKLDSAGFGAEYNNVSAAVIEANSRDPYATSQAIVDLSLLRAGVFLETGDDDDGGFLSARQSLFQYYIKNLMDEEDFSLTTVPEFYDYQGKYQWRWDRDKVSIQAMGARDKAGVLFDEDSDEVEQDPELSGGIEYYNQFHSQGLLWEHFYESGMTHKAGLYRLDQNFRFRLGHNNRIDVNTVDQGIRTEFSRAVSADHTLMWGVHLVDRDIDATGKLQIPPCDEFQPDCRASTGKEELVISEHFDVLNADVFLTDEWVVSDTFTVTPGVLYSWDDYTEQSFLQPKLQTRWQFLDDWAWQTAYGNYHKLPNDFFSYSPTTGNQDLKQPESTHYETGLEYQYSDSLLARVDVYYKTMDKLILARQDESVYPGLNEEEYLALPKYTNDATGRAYGMELFINKDITDNWYGWLSVAYSRTFRKNEITDKSFRYQTDQPLIVNMVANYQWNDTWNLGMKWRMQSGQLITSVEGASFDPDQNAYQPVYGDLNSERLPMQHALDVRADRSMELFGMPTDFYVEAINLYGQNNVEGYEYSGDYSSREEVKALPTIVSFGFKIHTI